MVDELGQYIKYLYDGGAKISVTTNAELLDEKKYEEMRPYITNINIGINSLYPRDGADMVGRRIGMINGRTPVYINAVVSRENKDDLGGLMEFLQEREVDKVKLVEFSSVRGLAKQNRERFETGPGEYDMICEGLINEFPNLNIQKRALNELVQMYLRVAPNGDFEVIKNNETHVIGNPVRAQAVTQDEILSAFGVGASELELIRNFHTRQLR